MKELQNRITAMNASWASEKCDVCWRMDRVLKTSLATKVWRVAHASPPRHAHGPVRFGDSQLSPPLQHHEHDHFPLVRFMDGESVI
jgi:hypothetical protein